MASAVKFAVSNWHRQTRVLNFIYLQLVQLTTDIDKEVQNGMVSLQYMSKITHRLDIIENNSLQACNPPLEQSTMKKFETIRDLGKGSFGTVSLVRLKDTDKTFARKTIMDDNISNVLLERDILTFNNHPFVISMLCSIETKTSMCFLMEYAEGGDCETQLKRLGRFHSNTTHKFAAQIVLALEYIHSYGILHRDIKPANLLLTSNVTIKLADFGLCKIGPVNMTVDRTRVDIKEIVREFTDKERTGTITHMPPEVIQKQGYGKPVDWWALGITLYQFLTGSYPFTGHTKEDTMNEVVHMELIWPEGFFPERDEKDFITRLLEKDPRKRLGTFGASEVKAHPYLKFVDWNKVLNLYDTSEPYDKPYTTVSAKRRIQRLLQEYKAQTAASWEF